jgi:anti-anti-sigma factor
MGTLLQVVAGQRPREVHVVGELDASTTETLAEALDVPLKEDGDLVLDIAGLTFIDSAGIRLILIASQLLGDRGSVVLRSPTRMVRRVIALTGVDKAPNLRIEFEGDSPEPTCRASAGSET